MGLITGTKLGRYEICSKIGEGGMGEVYLAHDPQLDRKVALKILAAGLASNQERMRRFVQEAKAAAALNHPNIAHIYEIGEASGLNFIAMEFIEGENLRDALAGARLDIGRVLELAAQVASGLATAHHRGIVHRDIKPENLMVTATRQIKILDFGLAKLVEQQCTSLDASDLTTVNYMGAGPQAETSAGMLLGTVAYMSPEQAQGGAIDQCTDTFSLGVVLYEMLTGRRPFKGKSSVDSLHSIIHDEPPSALELNPGLPIQVEEILDKAMAKDPAERYQHVGDFALDLRRLKRAIETKSLPGDGAKHDAAGGKAETRPASVRSLLSYSVAAALLIAVGIAAYFLGRSNARPPRPFALDGATLTPLTTDPGYEGEPTFSSDGQTIAYVSDRTGNFEIFLKQISGGPDINLTNNAADDAQPAFSPDGKQIAFVSARQSSKSLLYQGTDGALVGGDIWIMPALGGSARRIAEAGNFPAWSPDGSTIIYTSGASWYQSKMYKVAAAGGEPQEIPINFKANEPLAAFLLYASYSGDGHWIVFEARQSIFVVNAAGGEPKQIVTGKRPVWSSAAILYSNGEPGKNLSLWKIPFSTSAGLPSGPAEPLTLGRGQDTQAAVSPDGKLVAFAAQTISFNVEALAIDAETGRVTDAPRPITSGSDISYFLNPSPDGRSVVFNSRRGVSSHIWRVDLGSVPVQLTSDPNLADSYPRWSPDGHTIAFARQIVNAPQAKTSLWLMTSDGANPRILVENASNAVWSPDGTAFAYSSVVDGHNQLNIFDLKTKQPRRLTDEPGVVPISVFSPDGKWLVYQSNRTGNLDLWALPLAGGEARAVVTTPHYDYHPSFSPSGKWLYFQLDHKNLYRVPGPAQEWRSAAPEKVTNFPESNLFIEDPQISRDGHQLFYSHGHITGDIWIIKLGQ
ncbi:MAG: protein kinase [bacterium]